MLPQSSILLILSWTKFVLTLTKKEEKSSRDTIFDWIFYPLVFKVFIHILCYEMLNKQRGNRRHTAEPNWIIQMVDKNFLKNKLEKRTSIHSHENLFRPGKVLSLGKVFFSFSEPKSLNDDSREKQHYRSE